MQNRSSNNPELSENEESLEDESSETETAVLGSTTTITRLRKPPSTPVNSSKTAKGHLQSSNNDKLPENEESSKDNSSQSEMTNLGCTTSTRLRKRPLTSVSSTKTVKRQRQS